MNTVHDRKASGQVFDLSRETMNVPAPATTHERDVRALFKIAMENSRLAAIASAEREPAVPMPK